MTSRGILEGTQQGQWHIWMCLRLLQHSAPSVDKESKGVGRNGIDENIVDTKFSKCKGITQFLMAAHKNSKNDAFE